MYFVEVSIIVFDFSHISLKSLKILNDFMHRIIG